MKDDNMFSHPSQGISDPLTGILRDGARKLITRAVEAELVSLLTQYADEKLPDGRARLVTMPLDSR